MVSEHKIGTKADILETDGDYIEFLVSNVSQAAEAASVAEKTSVHQLDGNMNAVRRISFQNHDGIIDSYILKHVPEGGALSSYPTVIFGEDRLDFEVKWYQQVEQWQCSQKILERYQVTIPKVFFHDQESRTIIIQDVMPSKPLNAILRGNHSFKSQVGQIGTFLGNFHRVSQNFDSISNSSAELNREYVFKVHIEQPEKVQELWRHSLSIDSGNSESNLNQQLLESRISAQEEYLDKFGKIVGEILQRLSENFKASPFTVYTHGDLHCQSILVKPDSDQVIIDAELSDSGNAAFDVGTITAHILAHCLTSNKSLIRSIEIVTFFLQNYTNSFIEETSRFYPLTQERQLLNNIALYTGAELLRRLIGPAGFPIQLSNEDFSLLLRLSTELIVTPEKLNIWISDT